MLLQKNRNKLMPLDSGNVTGANTTGLSMASSSSMNAEKFNLFKKITATNHQLLMNFLDTDNYIRLHGNSKLSSERYACDREGKQVFAAFDFKSKRLDQIGNRLQEFLNYDNNNNSSNNRNSEPQNIDCDLLSTTTDTFKSKVGNNKNFVSMMIPSVSGFLYNQHNHDRLVE